MSDPRLPSVRYPNVRLFYVYGGRWPGVTFCPACADHVHSLSARHRIIPRANLDPITYCHRCRLIDGWIDRDGVTRYL